MKLLVASLLPVVIAFSNSASAVDDNAKLISVFKQVSIGGKPANREISAALVNMDEIMDSPRDGCSQFIGQIKVDGLQFSSSGATLESFRFTDPNGAVWSVPTNIGKLSNAGRGTANSFIKVGKSYFAHIQACGSGGFASLISLYDTSIKFGPK